MRALAASLALILPAAAFAKGAMPTPYNPLPTGDAEEAFAYNFINRQSVEIADLPVQIRSDNASAAPEGAYIYLRVSLDNTTGAPQPVTLEYTSPSSGGTVSRSLELAPGQGRTVVLPIPSAMSYGSLRASGPAFGTTDKHPLYFSHMARHLVLVVGDEQRIQRGFSFPPSSGSDVTTSFILLSSDELADELAPYIGFDEVALLDVGLPELRESQRSALEAYAATGGTLVLGKPGPRPENYLPLLGKGERYGFGKVLTCDGADCSAQMRYALTLATLPVRPHGQFAGSRYLGGIDPTRKEAYLLPQALAPLGRFLVIILAFSIIIGPGSWWVARRKGPAAVLTFIPGVAFVTCGLLVGYSLFHDGFILHSTTRSLTLLDRERGRAVTVGLASFFANLAPTHADFDGHTAIVFPGQSTPQPASVDWTRGARFGPDFIPSRNYREWGVMSVEPSRARLIVETRGDGLRVRNALGGTVRLAHIAHGGKLWRVSDLRDGREADATRMSGAEPLPPVNVPEYAGRFEVGIAQAVKAELQDGEFLADFEGPGPLPLGGLDLTHRDSEALIRGKVDGP